MVEVVASLSGVEPKGRVLLIDGEAAIRASYSDVLSRAGFLVDTLETGKAAAKLLDALEFDMVLSDVATPGMSGVEVLRLVHRHDPDMPVVLMASGSELENAVQAIDHGALRYLVKPVAEAVLTGVAEEALRARRDAKLKRRAMDLLAGAAQAEAEHAELSRRFDRALEQLQIVFQPIVRWSDRSVFAYEALVRSREPSLRMPKELFSAAERLERVPELGRLIRLSIAKIVVETPPSVRTFVNLHAQELADETLLSPSSPLSQVAGRVVLEITERSSLDEVTRLHERLDTLRKLGFGIAVDDMGAGYAGLTSFARLRPDIVKLDMSLASGIDLDPMKAKLVQFLLGACRELGTPVIAEGIESIEDRDALVAVGCDLLQGFLFARPAAPFPEVTWW